jgi:hypothetical protein
MRTSTYGGCAPESVLGQVPWESFIAQKTFPFTPPLNWSTFYVSVQYRDSPGNVSPVYCDDIAVEGMPPTPLPNRKSEEL